MEPVLVVTPFSEVLVTGVLREEDRGGTMASSTGVDDLWSGGGLVSVGEDETCLSRIVDLAPPVTGGEPIRN